MPADASNVTLLLMGRELDLLFVLSSVPTMVVSGFRGTVSSLATTELLRDLPVSKNYNFLCPVNLHYMTQMSSTAKYDNLASFGKFCHL